jgi:hypothetical protein
MRSPTVLIAAGPVVGVVASRTVKFAPETSVRRVLAAAVVGWRATAAVRAVCVGGRIAAAGAAPAGAIATRRTVRQAAATTRRGRTGRATTATRMSSAVVTSARSGLLESRLTLGRHSACTALGVSVNPYVITSGAFVLIAYLAVGSGLSFAALLVGTAFLAGWSSAWSP